MAMTINSLPDAAPRVKGPARRRYGATYKLEILAEYDNLDRDG